MNTRMAKLFSLSSESDSDEEVEEIILLYTLSKRQKLTHAIDYVKERESHGEFALTTELSDKSFIDNYCLNRNQFDEVLNILRPSIHSYGCNAKKPIDPEEKLSVFLRYLTSGDTYKNIGYSYMMSDRTVSKIVEEVTTAIWDIMQPLYLPEPTTEMWKSIALEYEQKWQFPHCIGALDGKHIIIKKKLRSGSSFLNYRQRCPVLIAIVDANYKFISVEVGLLKKFSDPNAFSNSVFEKQLSELTPQLPSPELLPNFGKPLPYVFVSNKAFTLSENLMKPYPGKNLTLNFKNKTFNYKLSRARQTVECTFRMLASQFHIFQKPFEIKVQSVDKVAKAACVLHNYLRSGTIPSNNVQNIIEKLPINQLLPMRHANKRCVTGALFVRRNFTDYFKRNLTSNINE